MGYFWFTVFVSANALLLMVLAANVSRLRLKYRISLGDGDNKELRNAIRAHANGVEQVPIFGLLVLALSLAQASSILLGVLVILFTASRYLHAYGMTCRVFIFRRIGAGLTYLMNIVAVIAAILIVCLSLFFGPAAQANEAEWVDLLDEDLSHWNKYLAVPGKHVEASYVENNYSEPLGHNNDPLNVFTVSLLKGEPVLHVTGEVYGSVYTKKQYENYHLTLEVKWGDKKYPPRLDLEMDSGILYHSIGEHGVDYWKAWTLSQELQIIEGGLGDYWSLAGAQIDIACVLSESSGNYVYQKESNWLSFGGDTGVNVHCRRGEDRELEKGKWNTMELISFGDKSLHVVNGKVVMALKNSRYTKEGKEIPLTRGHILLQSEAGEVFFRNVKIKSISGIPGKYADYY